jgi:Mn-dependent DtxR family transcriptional regulator
MHESGEDYLETILMIKNRKGSVRSIDVARELGFSRPSVSRAISILQKDGFVIKKEDGELVLTEIGIEKATAVYDRHTTLTKFIQMVCGVDETIAEEDACRIEHVIHEETFAGIKKFIIKHNEELTSK